MNSFSTSSTESSSVTEGYIKYFMATRCAKIMTKYGYQPGQGLGAHNQGSAEPIITKYRSPNDRAGVYTKTDQPARQPDPRISVFNRHQKGDAMKYAALIEDYKVRFPAPAEVVGTPLTETPVPTAKPTSMAQLASLRGDSWFNGNEDEKPASVSATNPIAFVPATNPIASVPATKSVSSFFKPLLTSPTSSPVVIIAGPKVVTMCAPNSTSARSSYKSPIPWGDMCDEEEKDPLPGMIKLMTLKTTLVPMPPIDERNANETRHLGPNIYGMNPKGQKKLQKTCSGRESGFWCRGCIQGLLNGRLANARADPNQADAFKLFTAAVAQTDSYEGGAPQYTDEHIARTTQQLRGHVTKYAGNAAKLALIKEVVNANACYYIDYDDL